MPSAWCALPLDRGSQEVAVTDELDVSLRRYRALGDPSRARILAALSAEAPLDASELATRTGLHVSTVRMHVKVLQHSGLLRAERVSSGRRGRPRFVYSATDAVAEEGDRRYRLLAGVLATLAARTGSETAELETLGEATGRSLVESPAPDANIPDDESVAGLLAVLEQTGFAPELAGERRGRRILMRSCPFLELARQHRDVICPIHLGLIRGALSELGASSTATRLEPFVRPDLCVAHLARGAARRGSPRRSPSRGAPGRGR
jgi:predicted ArsR family transcriptional regulator